jgi:Flp pilus assembly protein TadD
MRRYSGCAAFLFFFLLIPLSLIAQEASPFPSTWGHRRIRFSISGTVRDSETSQGISGAQVELRNLNGAAIAIVETDGSGSFLFNDVRSGDYYLTAEGPGYGAANEHVQLRDSPAFTVDLFLHRVGNGRGESKEATISVRELSIPHKAHDAMEKGLELLYQKSQYQQSLEQFQRAIQDYPDYYEAYAQVGVAYMYLKEPDKAEQALRTSIEVSKEKYLDAFYLLALLYSNSGRYAEAEPLARKGTELDAQSWQCQYELARALYGLHRFAEAESYAETAVKLQPRNAVMRLELAKIHMQMHKYPALLDDLNAYLEIAPTGAQADQVRKARDKIQQSLANTQAATPSAPRASKP